MCDREPYFTDAVVKDYIQRGLHKVCQFDEVIHLPPIIGTYSHHTSNHSEYYVNLSQMCHVANGIVTNAFYGVPTCCLVFFCNV